MVEPSPDAAPRRPRWLWPVVTAAVVLVAVIAVVATLLLTRNDDVATLPTGASGPSLPETTGRLGANTFANPVLLQDNAMPIPAHTTVQVRCRFYAPSIPSVEPDGYWYLIDSGKWAGRWTPANSFMNGDVPGQPTLHNTDMAVPVCR
jgi:flagellar biosynthesis/type III secretory pathway M-ring protein FliF/YscJ